MAAAVTARSFPVITEPFEVMGTQRVMVVDGDASSRSILEVSLKRAGFEVAVATNGREALSSLQSTAAAGKLPAAMVLSTELPGEDGYSLCAQLRAEPKTAKLPVLLLARADEDEKNTLADVVGADELVAKPAFARDVAALVTLWIAGRDDSGARVLDTKTLPLPVCLRALLSTQRAGMLSLSKKAFIAYRAGRVTHAEADGATGVDALVRVLALGQGGYKVAFTIPTTPANVEVPLRELVNGIFPRLQKWEALAARSVPLESRFQLDFPALARALPTIPDAVNQVVRLFDGQRDVRHVLFDSPLNESVTLEVANRLQLMGIVKPVTQTPDEIIPRQAPKLFEPRSSEAEERMSTLFGSVNDLQELIVTPAENVLPQGTDWWQPPKGTGLEVESANDGWIEQQLSAFKIQSVVEPPRVEPEVLAFTKGTQPAPAAEAPTLLEEAIAPIQLTDLAQPVEAPVPPPAVVPAPVPAAASSKSLEEEFFGNDDTDPSVKTVPVPQAIEDTYVPPKHRAAETAAAADAPADSDEALVLQPSGSKWLALSFGAALFIALIGVVTWKVSSSEEEAFVPPPIVLPEPPKPEPVEPKLEVPEVNVSDEQVALALKEATAQYEEAQFGEAIATLEQITEVAPSSVPAWMLLAMARFDNGDPAQAEEAAMTVLALDPNHADAFLLLATIHIRAGKRDVAAGEIGRYLELEPNGKHADEAKRLLKR